MIGAIAGDIIGSVHEYTGTKTTKFPLFGPGCGFTDDSVLTLAVADSLLTGASYVDKFHEYFHAYPHSGYGVRFSRWAADRRREPYNSWGNGSAMRVSPVGFAFETLEEVLEEARRSAEPTHDHPGGIAGAQATAAAVFLARTGEGKAGIKATLERLFHYDLDHSLDEIRPGYAFTEACQATVPPAVRAFLESESYEEAVRNAVSLGGDADTLACIAGGIAEAYYGTVPGKIATRALSLLDERLRLVVDAFYRRFAGGGREWHRPRG